MLWNFQNGQFFGNGRNIVTPLNDTRIILVFLCEMLFKYSEIWYSQRRAFIYDFHLVFVVEGCAQNC